MKCLIIGLGSIAKKHIHVIETYYPKIELFAYRSQLKSSVYSKVKNLYDWDAIENQSESWDVVMLCNPTVLHATILQKIMHWETAFFIEKPLFHSTLNNASLVQSFQNKEQLTYIACNLRFLDCLRFIKEYLSNTKEISSIQEVNSYCGSYLPDWRAGQDYKKVYSANKEMGGGVHLDLIHEIDYLYWLFGKPHEIHSLFRNQSKLQIDAFDYANYNLVYDHFAANVILNYYRRDTKRTLELVFDDRTVLVNLLSNRVYENDTLIFSSDQKGLDTYKLQLDYFLNLLSKGESKSFNDIEAGWETLQICLNYEAKR